MRVLSLLPERSIFGLHPWSAASNVHLSGIALLERCSQAGYPATVALKRTTVDELFGHDEQDTSEEVQEGVEMLCRRGPSFLLTGIIVVGRSSKLCKALIAILPRLTCQDVYSILNSS